MTKSDKFGGLKIYILKSTLLSFLLAQDANYLKLSFCKFVKDTIGYIRDFFQIRLKFVNIFFDHWNSGERNLHSSIDPVVLYNVLVFEFSKHA